MQKSFLLVVPVLMLFVITGTVSADLITIGTAGYDSDGDGDSELYNLIYDDNDDLIWLDYSNPADGWQKQMDWAAGLSPQLTINLDGYTVSWDDGAWRLPGSADDLTEDYNQTNAEMGDLYYTELGNTGSGLDNTGDFENLIAGKYWYGIECTGTSFLSEAWYFDMWDGYQGDPSPFAPGYGMAVRSGQAAPIPEPATILLFVSGLAGFVCFKRRRHGAGRSCRQ